LDTASLRLYFLFYFISSTTSLGHNPDKNSTWTWAYKFFAKLAIMYSWLYLNTCAATLGDETAIATWDSSKVY